MISTAHAVTPTDTRDPPKRASEKSDSRLGEQCAEFSELVLALADEAACSDIECCCRQTRDAKYTWYDTHMPTGFSSAADDERQTIARALRYFELRGDDCTHYQVVRCQAFPSLIRFEYTR